jgi:signal transduction histidine kinase
MLGTFLHRVAKLGDGIVVFLHDVTDERRMQAELKAYADVVAHDLSAPLSGIALLVTALEQRPEQPPSVEILQELRATTRRARGLIDGVLDYARSGELTRDRVDLHDVMAEVRADLRVELDDANACVVLAELPEVEGDPRQLRRVFQNLVANAVKFRSDRPPRIEISAHRGSREWVVSVQDNGIGIRREDVGHVFDMFSRVTPNVDGTGIGLAVCRRVVEAHGGRIWVEPAEGGGSVFRFTLPAAEVREPEPTV